MYLGNLQAFFFIYSLFYGYFCVRKKQNDYDFKAYFDIEL